MMRTAGNYKIANNTKDRSLALKRRKEK